MNHYYIFLSYRIIVVHDLILAYENGRLHIAATHVDRQFNTVSYPQVISSAFIRKEWNLVFLLTNSSVYLVGDELSEYMQYIHGGYRIDPSIIDDLY